MESSVNAFVESQKKKQRKKRRNSIIILCAVALVVVAAIVLLLRTMEAQAASMSVLSYNAESVREGEVATTISGSGTLSATKSDTITSAAAVTVESIGFLPGDAIQAGEVIMTLSSDELKQQLDTLRDELDSLQSAIAGTTRELSNLNVTASKKGIVKDVRAGAGDAAEDLNYLCLISTDGRMKLEIDAPDGVKKYDKLYVSVEGAEPVEGSVTDISKGKAAIVFADDGYAVGAAAEALDEGGTLLGSGQITVNDHVEAGMSNGNYVAISASGLTVGDLIWVPTRTTLASYSPNTTTNFGFGGGMRVDTVEEYSIDTNPGGGMGQPPEGGGNMGGLPGGN